MPNILKLDAERKKTILALLANGNTLAYSCAKAKVCTQTVYLHRQKSPEFDAAVKAAMKSRIEIVVDSLYKKAVGGDLGAAVFFLVNRTKFLPAEDRWENAQHVKHSGDDNAPPIRIETTPLDKASIEELRLLRDFRDRLLDHRRNGSQAEGPPADGVDGPGLPAGRSELA